MSPAHVGTGLCDYDVLPWLSMVEVVQSDRTISLGFCWFLGLSLDLCHLADNDPPITVLFLFTEVLVTAWRHPQGLWAPVFL